MGKRKGVIGFYNTSRSFLRNMVRAIVGTLIDVGIGKISQQDFVNIILSKTAPMQEPRCLQKVCI